MKYISLSLMLAFAFQLPANAQVGNKMYKRFLKGIYHKKTPTLSCDSLNAALDKYTVLDIRSEEEYEVSHIRGAQFVNYDTFKDNDFSQYNKETPIALIMYMEAFLNGQIKPYL